MEPLSLIHQIRKASIGRIQWEKFVPTKIVNDQRVILKRVSFLETISNSYLNQYKIYELFYRKRMNYLVFTRLLQNLKNIAIKFLNFFQNDFSLLINTSHVESRSHSEDRNIDSSSQEILLLMK